MHSKVHPYASMVDGFTCGELYTPPSFPFPHHRLPLVAQKRLITRALVLRAGSCLSGKRTGGKGPKENKPSLRLFKLKPLRRMEEGIFLIRTRTMKSPESRHGRWCITRPFQIWLADQKPVYYACQKIVIYYYNAVWGLWWIFKFGFEYIAYEFFNVDSILFDCIQFVAMMIKLINAYLVKNFVFQYILVF